jgi:hypothetical protein
MLFAICIYAQDVNVRVTCSVVTGRVLTQAVSHQLLPRSGFDLELFRVGFVAENVALGQVLSEYFGFSPSVAFHQLHTHSCVYD